MCILLKKLNLMTAILKDLGFIIKKIFLSEKKLLKKRIIRSIKNEYEKEIKVLPELIKQGTDTIDVGVYRGVYSYELSRLSNHVHLFEANPIIYEYLQKNLTRIIKNITLYNYALSDRKGIAKFRVPIRRKTIFQSQFEEKYHAGRGTIHEPNVFDKFDKFDVKTIKLDDFEFSNKISLIKIDVEGHELKVIDGAKETIKKHKPNLLVEIQEQHSKEKLLKSISYIQNLHYECFVFHNNILLNIKDYKGFNKEYNFIFIYKDSLS